jgi:zinc protease
VRQRLLSFARGEARAPRLVADLQFNAAAFADHPYARAPAGSEASINRISAEDLRTYRQRVFARDRLKVVAVGDISADELGKFLDRAFGDLPERAELADVPKIRPVTGGRLRVAEVEVPQSVVAFGLGGVPHDSRDFVPAELLSHIVGGSGPHSRLFTELRQKRGLAHGVSSWLERRQEAAIFRGRITARNEVVGEVLDVLRDELQRMSDGDLSVAELDEAKAYMLGSDPVGFRSHVWLSALLLHYAQSGFGPDFHESRHAMIAAVTLDDLKRVAANMLNPENLIVSIAGTPALQPVPSRRQ